MIGIFNDQEQQTKEIFERRFTEEIEVFNQLLKVHEAFIFATNGLIKDTDYPNWTIHLLLSQTVPLMENAIKLLSTGYIRTSEILIRVSGEAIILSTYFKEFPEAEEQYRTLDHNQFFRTHRVKDMMQKVEESGKIFFSQKKNKKVYYNEIMFVNLYKEASRFVHNNPEVIYSISRSSQHADDENKLILGPQLYSDDILCMGLRRQLEILLFSIVVMGLSLNIIADEQEKKILDEASRLANKLTENQK